MVVKGKRYKVNPIKMIRSILILILLIFLIGQGIKNIIKKLKYSNDAVIEVSSKVEKVQNDITINLVAIGDVMCHNTNFKAAYNSSTKTYDFSPAFENVSKYIKKADILIVNQITCLLHGMKSI